MLMEMLNILSRFDLNALGHNSTQYIRVVAEAMKQATADKDRFVGDPSFVDVPVERLLSREHADAAADGIRHGRKVSVPRVGGGWPSKDTTQALRRPRAGELRDDDALPGNAVGRHHRRARLHVQRLHGGLRSPARAGGIAGTGGKARFSSMCPSIFFKVNSPASSSARPALPRSRWACCRPV